jgi:gamma-glutamylcyclotransferase (GGCT)/AIG2-like uncharacterized protein YtfP
MLLQARAHFAGEASAQGRLYHLGRFPGAIFGKDCPTKVHGEVFRLSGSSLLDALDAYEGCALGGQEPQLFSRDIIEVTLSRGGTLSTWTYRFAGKVSSRPLIRSGRFQLR